MPATLTREIAWQVGNHWLSEQYFEAASQTFKAGEPVAISGNTVVALQAADAEHLTTTGTKLLGFALRDAQNLGATSARRDMGVAIPTALAIYACPVWAAVITNAEVQDIGNPGTQVALRNVASVPVANLGTTPNGTLKIWKVPEDVAATDTYVTVQFRIMTTSLLY